MRIHYILATAVTMLIFALSPYLTSCSSSSTTEPEETPEEPQEETLTPPTIDNEKWCGVIKADEYYGRVLSKIFYDLKYAATGVSSSSSAYTYFVLDKMNGIRCSIFGNSDVPAHPSSGVVVSSYYDNTVTAIKYAMIARGDEPLTIFASKKLYSQNTFPDWVKDSDGKVDPENYSKMLLDYVKYMDSEGITIGVIGIDNEPEWNEGGIEPDIYHATVTRLKERLADAGLPIPLFIAPELYRVDNTRMQTLCNNEEYASSMDIYGMHYYPTQRVNYYEPLKVDIELKGDREFWATEPHWNLDSDIKDPYTDVLHYAEDTIGAIWDQTDLGLDNLMWWQYGRFRGDTRGYLIYNITVPIFEAQPIMVEDHDGWDIRDSGLLHTRAFRRDKTIVFYALNLCANTSENENYTNYHFKVDGVKVAGSSATQRQWRDDALLEGEESTINVYDNESIYLNLPSRSITMVEITLE